MNQILRVLSLAGLAVTLLTAPKAVAQGPGGGGPPGNFDPEQMRARMMERYREQLEITSDDEWKLIQERVTKVNEARREAGGMGMGRGGFQPRRGGQGGGGGGDTAAAGQGGQRQNRNPFGTTLPEAEDLQKALEAKASPDEIKAKLAKYREARKAKQAALAKAQEELRAVLSVRQEAAAVMAGLLD